MSVQSKLGLLAFLALSFVTIPRASAEIVLSDPIDEFDDWGLIGGGWTNGVGGLSPSVGTTYWGSTFNFPATVGLSKDFGLNIESGRYLLSIDVSAPFGDPIYDAVPYLDFTSFGLTGISTLPTVISASTPPESTPQWTTWSFEYVVAPDSSDVGNAIGFTALLSADDYTMMLDNLSISRVTAVPEPNLMISLGLGSCLLVFSKSRKR